VRTRTKALVIAMLSVATVAAGLRVGAGAGVCTARVFGAPRSPRATALAWQLRVMRDAGGVTEPVETSFVLEATWPLGSARVQGKTDEVGVAEVDIPAPAGSELRLRVVDESGALLAEGPVQWGAARWEESGEPAWLPPTKEEGPLGVAVAAQGGRLVAGAPGTLLVRVTGTQKAVTLEVEPEPGLDVRDTHVLACASGWAELPVTAQMHVAGLRIRAKDEAGVTGEWFGAVPVAGGALFPEHALLDRTPSAMWIHTSGEPRPAYAEVDDAEGRVVATTTRLALAPELHGDDAPTDPFPRSRLDVPHLPAGDYWLVLSSDPSGAERLSGATLAHPLHVGPPLDRCDALPVRARAAVRGFPRWLALDGLATSRAAQRGKRDQGRAIAAAGLAFGALLEVLLVLRAARAARAARDLLAGEGEPASRPARLRGGLDVGIAILLVLLGFALILGLVLVAR
jgi:hypothetical protein